MKKKLVVPTLVVGAMMAGGLLTVAGQTQAHGFGQSDFKQKLIERFQLDPDQVDSFFAERREEGRQKHQEMLNAKLDEAIANGELTEAQKELLLAKMEEEKQNFESFKDLSPEQRREQMKQKGEDLKAWAEENGIDLKFLHGPGKRFGKHRLMRPGGENNS